MAGKTTTFLGVIALLTLFMFAALPAAVRAAAPSYDGCIPVLDAVQLKMRNIEWLRTLSDSKLASRGLTRDGLTASYSAATAQSDNFTQTKTRLGYNIDYYESVLARPYSYFTEHSMDRSNYEIGLARADAAYQNFIASCVYLKPEEMPEWGTCDRVPWLENAVRYYGELLAKPDSYFTQYNMNKTAYVIGLRDAQEEIPVARASCVANGNATTTTTISQTTTTIPRVCTDDVQACPGGWYVARIGQNCEFAPCPSPYATATFVQIAVHVGVGGPISGAWVNLHNSTWNGSIYTTSDGVASFSGLLRGPYNVYASAVGYSEVGAGGAQDIFIRPPSKARTTYFASLTPSTTTTVIYSTTTTTLKTTTTTTITATNSTALVVTVRDANSGSANGYAPIYNARVTFRNGTWDRSAYTNYEGAASFTSLVPGVYFVQVSADGFHGLENVSAPVPVQFSYPYVTYYLTRLPTATTTTIHPEETTTVNPEATTTTEDLTVATFLATVRDANAGSPIHGARVAIYNGTWNYSTYTNYDGAASFRGLVPGEYSIYVFATGYHVIEGGSASVQLPSTEETYRLEHLPPAETTAHPTTTTIPGCSCTEFKGVGCGLGDCPAGYMHQTRQCTPQGCFAETTCVVSDECKAKDNATKPPEEKPKSSSCNGCLMGTTCVPAGGRKSGSYCSYDLTAQAQKEKGSCDNSFECASNLCINDGCVTPSLWNRILRWFGLAG